MIRPLNHFLVAFPPVAKRALPLPYLIGQGASDTFRSLRGTDALGPASESHLARGLRSFQRSLRVFLFPKSRAVRCGSCERPKLVTSLLALGRVVSARAPFFGNRTMSEQCGRFTLLINREAGFVVISGEHHQAQLDKAELRKWIGFYRRMVAGKTGEFYVGTLRAHQRALELLTSEEVAA